MNVKRILSIMLVVALMISAVVLATAESTETTATETAAEDTATAETTEEADTATVYTLDEMLNMAINDAYARQAAYAVYAEAFPDSRSITGVDMSTQIVLLEMLLKANGVTLPAYSEDITVPETKTDAYAALATAETDAVTMYRTFLNQESLPDDAQLVFRAVLQSVSTNASTFVRKAKVAQRAEEWQTAIENSNVQIYKVEKGNGRNQWTLYVYANDTADEATEATDDTTETITEDSVSN